MVLHNALKVRGVRSKIPKDVLEVLQRNNYVDRFIADGGRFHRVWFEPGVVIRKTKPIPISNAVLWVAKRRIPNSDFILKTQEGFVTEKEARKLDLDGILQYKILTGVHDAAFQNAGI